MAYKDKDAQRAYQRAWVARKRGSTEGSTLPQAQGSTGEGSTGSTPDVKARLEAVGISLDGNKVQNTVRPRITLSSGRSRPKRRDEMTPDELGITGHDADGNPLWEEG